MTPLERAQRYTERGLAVLPLPPRSKVPVICGWESFMPGDGLKHFNGAGNIGVVLGVNSGGRVDVDLDVAEAIALAPTFLPPTSCRFGRRSKPESHWEYLADPLVDTIKFPDIAKRADDETAMVVELRSSGAQTVYPGSVHPSGEVIEFSSDGEPARVDGADLARRVRHLAVAAMVARHWPPAGSRHDAALAAAGFLLRADIDESTTAQIIVAASRVAGDPEWSDRKRAVFDTVKALADGDEVTGGPRLAELLTGDGRKVVARVRQWLGVTGDDAAGIDAGDGDLRRVSEAAIAALLATNDPPAVFSYGGAPVRLERDEHDAPIIRPLTLDRMRHRMARVAPWYVLVGKDRKRVPAKPPKDVVADVLATPNPPWPRLTAIAEAPTVTAAGRVLVTPGYDAASGILYAPAAGFHLPPIPPRPDGSVLALALQLIDEFLYDFPFVGDAEKAHAIALYLLPFCRDLIQGPTPMHVIEKPAPATGSSLLADVTMYPGIGRPVPALGAPREDVEMEKRITAALRRGAPVLFFDNIPEKTRLDSSALARAITALCWNDRILGQSEDVRLPVRCVFIGSGNNPMVSQELARRIVRIRLDAKVEHPADRHDFRHPDLRGWVRDNRADLVWAALVLIQAWFAAGKPAGEATLGGFEAWSHTLGGILATANIPKFLANTDEFRRVADPEAQAVRAFLAAWWAKYDAGRVSVAQLYDLARQPDSAIDLNAKTDQGARIRLGRLLGTLRDQRRRLPGGQDVVVEQDGIVGGSIQWRLRRAD